MNSIDQSVYATTYTESITWRFTGSILADSKDVHYTDFGCSLKLYDASKQ